MPLPLWTLPFKEPHTEIKLINGSYYKYQISYLYDPAKKHTVKKSGPILGKITEQGFVPSPKHLLRQELLNPAADIKTYGIFALFSLLLRDEIPSLQETLGRPLADMLLSFAMFRWAYQSPIKRASLYHAHHFSAEFWATDRALTDKAVSGALQSIGENRGLVMTWLKLLLPESAARESFLLMDSTHVMSASERLEVNAKGYNNSFDFGKQIRLMYLFSATMKLPVYYRLLGGNIVDVAAMDLCVKEMGVSDVVYIADKGFYSTGNVAMLEQRNLKYIMPVRRSNPAIHYGPIGDGEFKIKNRRFIWQGRVIWYYQYEASGLQFATYLDDRLRVEEEQDYLTRIRTHPDTYTEEGYQERLRRFGTVTLVYRMSGTPAPDEVYMAYKQRNEIEMMFDSYKTFMKADVSYMQNRYVLEGWLFTNFIAMMAYYKLYGKLREAKLLGTYSPQDIIEMSKAVYKVRIRGTWYLAEVTAKVRKLLIKAGIDYLN
ncbi:MAG: transposase [Treponema sp.]|jgi:hypothetical protein|nr:transposase [Treponema sp.]